MMTSYRHSKGASGRVSKGLLVVSAAAIVLVALDALFGGRIQSVVQGGASLIWSSVGNVSSAFEESGLFVSHRSLQEENTTLHAKVLSLQSLEVTNAVLVDENNALRALAHAPIKDLGGVTVRVLSSLDASPYGTFVVQGGASDGIKEGGLVLGPGGVIIGVVGEVGALTSKVRVFLAPLAETGGFIGDSTAVTVLGRGGGNGIIRAPRDVPVVVGDLVYYSDHHAVIGVVGSIESSPADAEKTLYVRLPLNLFGLHFVTIVPSSL